METLGKDYGIKGIDGTGPWCFESWQPRTEIVLKRHDAYKWGPSMYKNKGPVKFEKLSIKIVPEDASRVAAIMGGQFDLTHQVPLQFIAQVKAAPNLTVQEAQPNFQLMYYGYKITRPMVSDKRVREAMNIAINRADIVKGVMLGNAEPAFTFVDPKALDFAEKTKGVIKEDVERAKQLLDEAGWKVGSDGIREKDGMKLAPRVLYTQVTYFPRVSEAIQGYMRKIGVDWKIIGFDSTIAPAEMGKQDYELWTVTVPYLSAGELMNIYFNSKNIPTPNRMNWKDAETDEWLRAGRAALTDTERALNYAPRAGEGDERASVDACHEHCHVHHQLEEDEGRQAAHALSEHLLQGTGLLVLMDTLLEVRGLKTHFATDRGLFRAVDGISFSVPRGRTIGLVGESGCGKSVTSLSVMGLVPSPPGKVEAEAVLFGNRDVLRLSADERRKLRGGKMSMIFQEPMTSLNPVHTVGQQIVEAILAHSAMSPRAARERAIEMLDLVRIPSPAQRIDDFPHNMSGGMRQRVMIAMALSCEPALLIADEPTTALDVTIQAQILDLLSDLQQRLGMAILIITHDLGVIAEVADQVLVMYAGRIVESADVNDLFADPQHPYTIGLLGSIPRIDVDRERLATIEGMVPSPNNQPAGCRFAPRCPFADQRCRLDPPPLRDIAPGHQVACWKAPVEVAS